MKKPDIVVSQVVAAPLATVWESWADFGGIYKFHDDVSKTTILTAAQPRGVGAVRLCELSDGRNEIEERVVEWDPMRKLGVEFKRDCCVNLSRPHDCLCGALCHAVSKIWVMNWISPRTPGSLVWMWPRLIVLIVSSPLRVALADRSDRKLWR